MGMSWLFGVCRQMLFQRIIKVKPFSSEEAWTLYMDNLERDKTLPLGEEQIAKSITRECGGLPLGIKTMVGAMGGSDWHSWVEECVGGNWKN